MYFFCINIHPHYINNMKNLNLTDAQIVDLRSIYQARLVEAQTAVDAVKNVLKQIDALQNGTTTSSVLADDSAPLKRRGRKPGKKTARKTTTRVSRTADAVATETAASLVSEPKKRGPKPGAKRGPKPGAKTDAKPGAKRGPKPGAKRGRKPGKKAITA